jgi:hypothetical protein
VSLTVSFRGSKVRKKIIREKSKIYKTSQNALKIRKSPNYLKKSARMTMEDWNFSKIHKTNKNFFWPKQKNQCLMILNDKPNWQVSRILMNLRPILSDSSENDPSSFREILNFLLKNFHWSMPCCVIWILKFSSNYFVSK